MCAKMIKDTIHDKSAHIAFKNILYMCTTLFHTASTLKIWRKNRFFLQKIAAFFRISRKFLAENVY